MTASGAFGKILIVDDHVDLAENLAEILAGAGYDAVIAFSAETGLDRIAHGDITGLITDYRLPGLSGADLIAEIRKRGERMPAVVMSAFTDEDTIDRARAAGAAHVLSKPVELDRLMALVAGMGRAEALILLVDDNRDLADNLAELLGSYGYPVAICGSLAEVRALTSKPTVAVLDYRLPDGTGVDIANELLGQDAGTRILFLSGYGSELRACLEGERALKVKAVQLDKPVDLPRLLAWVAEALERETAERPRR